MECAATDQNGTERVSIRQALADSWRQKHCDPMRTYQIAITNRFNDRGIPYIVPIFDDCTSPVYEKQLISEQTAFGSHFTI